MELLLYDIIVSLLIFIDMHKYDNQITPLTVIGATYSVLININNIFATKVYGFKFIKSHTLWMLVFFWSIFFVIDIFFGTLYSNIKKVEKKQNSSFYNYWLVMCFFSVGVLAYSLQFIRLYKIYGLNIKGKNNGILGHLCSFAFILGPVVLDLALRSKKKVRVILAGLMNILVILISVLFGGKYVLLINTTYLLLYFILQRDKKVNLISMVKLAIPLCVIAVGLFVILYYFVPIITGQYQSSMYFAIQHMFYYLLGPILGNNYALSHPGQGNYLAPYTVPINICKALFGKHDYVNPILPFVFQVSDDEIVNVAGLIGETTYELGVGNALMYLTIILIVVNVILLLYRAYNKCYLSLVYLFSILIFSFFCNYFTVSGVVLPLLLAAALDVASIFKIGNVHL